MSQLLTAILFLVALTTGGLALSEHVPNALWLDVTFVIASLAFLASFVRLLGHRLSYVATDARQRSHDSKHTWSDSHVRS